MAFDTDSRFESKKIGGGGACFVSEYLMAHLFSVALSCILRAIPLAAHCSFNVLS